MSALMLALLWWPFVVAAVAGAWLVFAKAGRPGWACLIPGYNGAEFLRVAKLPAWLCVLFLVPIVNIVLFAIACARVAHAFRKGPRFAVGLVLLAPVYMTILGMGAARYRRFELVPRSSEGPGPREQPGVTKRDRVPRLLSATAPVKLVALPGRTARTVETCGAGETRAAAGGERRGQARPSCQPHAPPRPWLHLV